LKKGVKTSYERKSAKSHFSIHEQSHDKLAPLEREVHRHGILCEEFHDLNQIIIMGSNVNKDKTITITIFQGDIKEVY